MPFSDAQIKALSSKLNGKHVRTREHRGTVLSYIEGWHVVSEANRIFGFDGWDREMVWAECVWQDPRRDPKACAYAARVRIRVRAGDTTVFRDGSGVGHGTGATIGEAHESALKEAETDATKRALTTFGNLFGLALYDKQQRGVRRVASIGLEKSLSIEWELISANDGTRSRHKSAQEFCAAIRRALKDINSRDQLDAFWLRNTSSISQLLAIGPELRTARGTHYADVLQRLYEQRKAQLASVGSEPEPVDADQVSVDKSALSLGAPRRVRDAAHLTFVASLPCLVCARSPSQAHHLRFAQPRALSSKPSDEWTVPLCALHHRALHDTGSEERWWGEQGIDPKIEAERLWQASRPGALPEDAGTPHAAE